MATLKLHKELEKVFGPDDAPTIPSFYMKQLLRLTWSGKMASDGLRPLCWRVFLGVISDKDKSLWKTQLNQQVIDYEVLKNKILPSLDKVKADPLSALSSGEGQSEEWSQYYKNVELSNFIKGDLDRLYLTGIEEENYFQTKNRRGMLLSILFLWSLQNPSTSYRQGMHEIVGCILFVIETERLAWEKAISRKEMSASHSMMGVFSEATLEAHTYYIFERIMEELQPLYDPVATKSHGVESQPFVVQFCTKIQG
jgi:TBC1 domain family protein 5